MFLTPIYPFQIRLQLETLLAEKARLAHENSVYARENRFLREVVEYHQLTMQDVIYLDEGTEEVTEVYPIKVPSCFDSITCLPFTTYITVLFNAFWTEFDTTFFSWPQVIPSPSSPPSEVRGLSPSYTL